MPDYKRVPEDVFTVSFHFDGKEAQFLTKENLLTFAENLRSQLKGRRLSLSVTFQGRMSGATIDLITDCFKSITRDVEFGSELSGLRAILTSVPNLGHATFILREVPDWINQLLQIRLNKRTGPTTVMEYVKPEDVDRRVDFYQKLHERYPAVEYVLHPHPEAEPSPENLSLFEALRSEGYFPGDKVYAAIKPEKLKINYRYSDIELSPREIKAKGLNRFQGMRCLAGQQGLVVASDGQVFASQCGHLPKVAKHINQPLVLPIAQICPSDVCNKNDDILYSKLEVVAPEK